jgi:hypothetical protein
MRRLFARPIKELLDRQPDKIWEGNAKALLDALNGARGDGLPERNWPKSPEGLRAALKRIAPNLRTDGIDIFFPPKGDKTRTITIEARKQPPVEDESADLWAETGASHE